MKCKCGTELLSCSYVHVIDDFELRKTEKQYVLTCPNCKEGSQIHWSQNECESEMKFKNRKCYSS